MKQYKLHIFDIDGTIADRDSDALLPGVAEWFVNRPQNVHIAFATNQGGVGLRYWMTIDGFGEPEKYPTAIDVAIRIDGILNKLSLGEFAVYVSYAYQSKSSGKWSPSPYDTNEWRYDWRKPAPGMPLEAMKTVGVSPSDTIMIGDSDEDKQAASAAGTDFMLAKDFFAQ